MNKTEKADIRIEDHAVQAINEDGERYYYSAGYVLQVPGRLQQDP